MAQMDPGTTSSAIPSTFHEYSSPTRTSAFRASTITPVTKAVPTASSSALEASSLLGALSSAADKTSASIAQGTRQSLDEIRQQRVADVEALDPGIRRLVNPHIYHVSLSQQLWDLKQELIESAMKQNL